jgi:hypothetical protein
MITFVTFHIDCNKKAANQIAQENILLDSRDAYMDMIEILFRSAAIFHPDCRKVVISDRDTNLAALSDDIEIHRLELDREAVMLSRLKGQIDYVNHHDFASDVVLLDSDILINGDLEPLFQRAFHVGLTYRELDEMPFNGGVILVSKQNQQAAIAFLEKVYQIYQQEYAKHSTWWGDQYALIDAVGGLQRFSQRQRDVLDVENSQVLFVPCDNYNFSPENRFRSLFAISPDQKILHFKGYRKRLMELYWQSFLQPRELSGIAGLLKLIVTRIKLFTMMLREFISSKKARMMGVLDRGKNLIGLGSN